MLRSIHQRISLHLNNKITDHILQSVNQRIGIFGSTFNENEINLQSVIFRFWVEMYSLSMFQVQIFHAVLSLLKEPLFRHSSTIRAVIPFAYLACLISTTGGSFPCRIVSKLVRSVTKLCLFMFSFINEPDVFHYISKVELFYLEKLISSYSFLNKTRIYNFVQNENIPGQGESMSTLRSVSSVPLNKNLLIAAQKTSINFQNKSNDELKSFSRAYKFVSYLLCQEFHLFAAYLHQNSIPPRYRPLLLLNQLKIRDMFF